MPIEAPVQAPKPKAEQAIDDLGANILQRARFALGWNNPAVAESTLAKNQARVTEQAKRAQIGSPGQRAEERYILALAKQDITRVRTAGLASGTREEGATGMVFAIPANKDRDENQPTAIGDTSYELWYMSYQAVEKALDTSHAAQASTEPLVDKYVYRAALGLIATQDASDDQDLIMRFDLHPVDKANLMQIARYMKSRDVHGRIPSRLEIIKQRVLHSGQFHTGENIVNFTTNHQPLAEQRTA